MSGAITLRVITPQKIQLETTASQVVVPGVDGLTGFLGGHAPLVTALGPGELSWTSNGKKESMFVSGGFAEVRDNTVRVVTEASEPATAIDVERAKKAAERARERMRERMKTAPESYDELRAEAAFLRAMMRLRIAGRRG